MAGRYPAGRAPKLVGYSGAVHTRREFLRNASAFVGSAFAAGGFGWLFQRVRAVPAARASVARPVICKQAWGGAPAGAGLVGHTVERLTVHHTAALLTDNRRAPRHIRGHQRFHQGSGWPDLAYHVVVDARGHLYEGRPVEYRGDTFTEYDPSGHFLVTCEGDFDRQAVPAAQLAGLADVLAWAAGEFEVAASTIGGHRDYAGTSCPGGSLYALLRDGRLAAMVEERLAAGGVALAPFCGTAAAELVAAIEAGTDGEPAAAGRFLLRHSNSPGPADEVRPFGERGWHPVHGRFGELP